MLVRGWEFLWGLDTKVNCQHIKKLFFALLIIVLVGVANEKGTVESSCLITSADYTEHSELAALNGL